MSTLSEYEEIVRRLPPNIGDILNLIRQGALTMSPKDLIKYLTALLAAGGPRDLIMRALILLSRLGLISPEVLVAAIAEAEAIAAAEAAAAAAGGSAAGSGTAGAGGAAAGGVAIGTILSILIALLSIIFAGYMIGSEIMTELEEPPAGKLCGKTERALKMATTKMHVSASAIGWKSAYNKAMQRAKDLCNQKHFIDICAEGDCDDSSCTCRPNVALVGYKGHYRVFWTTMDFEFYCVCECIA